MDFSRQEYWRGLPFPSPTCPLSISQCATPTNWDEVKGSTTFQKMYMYSLQYRVLEMDHIFPLCLSYQQYCRRKANVQYENNAISMRSVKRKHGQLMEFYKYYVSL